MKVKDLIEQLSVLDPELDVILQADAEGNGYKRACGATEVYYDGDEPDFGFVYDSIEEMKFHLEYDDAEPVKAAVVWPH